MSIFPTTDIVADVARAANPGKARLAFARLERATRAHDARDAHIAGVADVRNRTFSTGVAPSPSAARADAQTPSAGQKFEAFLLQSWLEILLPKEESGAFGSGGAGGVWRSLMAEQLGEQLARAGGIGVQKILSQSYDASPRSET
jgi:flagellar protein FlgJ